MKKTTATIALTAALAALLAGCGGSSDANTDAAGTPAASTPASPPAPVAKDAAALAAALEMGAPRVWTAETDPNQLLGRPGSYTSSATVVDKRVHCDSPKEPGASCGATVEVFATDADAKVRSDYIQSILQGGGLLGTEYHTLAGAALLRVTGQLTPKQAAVYAERFKAAS